MIVRSVRSIDLLVACAVSWALAASLVAAGSASTLTRMCERPRRMMCETIDVSDFAIAGFNPLFVALALVTGIVLIHLVLRLWAGWSVRFNNGKLTFSGLFNRRALPLDQVQAIGVWPGPFGISSRIDVYTRDGRRLFARNCDTGDAEALAAELRLLLPPR